jgi:hypothetical protein
MYIRPNAIRMISDPSMTKSLATSAPPSVSLSSSTWRNRRQRTTGAGARFEP